MEDRAATIENLRCQLSRLEIASNIIRQSIQDLESTQGPQQVQPRLAVEPTQQTQQVEDRDGNNILIGSRVRFLTKGRYRSTEGIVTRFSRNNTRVFAQDIDGFEVPRAPRNVRVIQDAK